MSDSVKARTRRNEVTQAGKIGGSLKRALDYMVHAPGRCTDNEAAALVGLSVTAIRNALRRPEVRRYLLEARQVLRTAMLADNLKVLAEVKDQKANQMARLAAVRAIENMTDDPIAAPGVAQRPGLIVVINTDSERAHHNTVSVDSIADTAEAVLNDQHLQRQVGPQGGTHLRRTTSLATDQTATIDLTPNPTGQPADAGGATDRAPLVAPGASRKGNPTPKTGRD